MNETHTKSWHRVHLFLNLIFFFICFIFDPWFLIDTLKRLLVKFYLIVTYLKLCTHHLIWIKINILCLNRNIIDRLLIVNNLHIYVTILMRFWSNLEKYLKKDLFDLVKFIRYIVLRLKKLKYFTPYCSSHIWRGKIDSFVFFLNHETFLHCVK